MATLKSERELRNLRFQRTGARRDLHNISIDTDALTTQDPIPIDDLQGNLSSIDRLMNKLEEYDTQIIYSLDTEETVLADMKDSEAIMQTTRRLTAKVRRVLASVISFAESSPRNSVSTIAQSPSGTQAGNAIHTVPHHQTTRQFAKLPNLLLPHFSGDPLEWTPFWDSFDSSVHSSNMSEVDKFNYLKSLLKGTAADAIAGISVTNNNYNTAVTLIKQRFGQRQIIINAHVESLISIPKSTNDTYSLRKMFDAIEVHVRGLEVLGITAAVNGAIMTPIILSKLPSDIRLILTRKHGTAVGDLDVLRELLKTEIEAREQSEIKENPHPPKQNTNEFTTGALFSQAKTYSCVYCKGNNHMSFACNQLNSPSSRKALLQKERRCFNCLRQGHSVDQCTSNDCCRRCSYRHHTSICLQRNDNTRRFNGSTPAGSANRFHASPQQPQRNFGPPGQHHTFERNSSRRPGQRRVNTNTVVDHFDPDSPQERTNEESSPFRPTAVLMSTSNSVVMQTALVNVSDSHNNLHTVRLLFDTGSQRSYATSSLIHRLGLKPHGSETLAIAPFGQSHSTKRSYDVVDVPCISRYNQDTHTISVVVVPQITQPVFRAPYTPNLQSATCNLQLADPPTKKDQWLHIDILIGLDYYWQIAKENAVRIPKSYLVAVPSSFGYLISGTNDIKSSSTQSSVMFVSHIPDSDDFLKQFWDAESFEVAHSHIHQKSENDPVLLRFDSTIKKSDGRYEVRLPWKENSQSLPTNYSLAKDRFQKLLRRLQKIELTAEYDKIIQQQLKFNFIEPVEPSQFDGEIVHYIAHHPVIKPDHATTKVRIVYDGSARINAESPSINDCLHPGPNLLNDIHCLLLQFRIHKIVVLADIEKAFLQVAIALLDRDATRFLWLKSLNLPFDDHNIQTFRFRRVPFGASCSPFLLAATLRHHLNESDDPVIKSLSSQFYVDNLSTGTETAEQAKHLYTKAKNYFKQGGMNLREWMSNSSEFISSLPTEDRAKNTTAKVLGIPWDNQTDTIYIKRPTISDDMVKVTKRHILHTISMIFDPLGIISPIVVPTKILIQDLWKRRLDWDSEVPDDIKTTWKSILLQLQAVSTIKLARMVPNLNAELHVFADASQKAYGAAAYLRSTNNNETCSRLLCSKSRVAPVKQTSIPRLELIALVMGTKLAKFIQQSIPHITKITLWSDSQVALCWIANTASKQDVFVKNRVSLINSHNITIGYCPTADNPADLCSRGMDTKKLAESHLWWNGPPWLAQSSMFWPAQPDCTRAAPDTFATLLATTDEHVIHASTPFTIELQRFSSLTRLLRTTAYCQRFIDCLRNVHTFTPGSPLNTNEIFDALNQWIKCVQATTYYKELKLLRIQKANLFIKQLQLFECNGIIRCKGRFLHAKIKDAAKSPVLLPKRHYFTDLVILHYHFKSLHQGVRHTVTSLRQDFWVPSLRQQVRPVLRKCRICIHWETPSYRLPLSSPLPIERLTQGPPFTFTGCDFAGPLFAFDDKSSSATKAYICLFTCAVTRAIHLELVNDLTTSSFLLALRRFIARRGVPNKIISDNAKTFKLAKTAIERLWHDVIVSTDTYDYVSIRGIKWQFNVERAPWWGGFFERMVGLVKRTLLKTAGKSKLSSVQLATLFTEIEAVLNSRPLTFVYSDLDAGQPLTPNNFLLQGQPSGIPSYKADPDPDFAVISSDSVLLRSMSTNQHLLDYYWSTWRDEYLAHLREYHQHWTKKQGLKTSFPAVGDLVLIKEDGLKRAKWKVGVIEKTYCNKDDHVVRSAEVRCSKVVLHRPTTLLYPLEICTHPTQPDTTDATDQVSTRPQRHSAQVAKIKIKQSLQ